MSNGINVDLKVDMTVLRRARPRLYPALHEAIAKTAFMVEARAKIKAPVDTGALRASIHTVLKSASHFEGSMADAIERSHHPNRFGEVRVLSSKNFGKTPAPKDDLTAFVGPSVNYSMEVEFGGQHAAQPYLIPALHESERDFYAFVQQAILSTLT